MTNSTHESALTISNLHKNYGKFSVIRNLDLEIAPHSIHGLVGLNGSGKTTTLECILGMQSFNEGQISVLGHKPARLHEAEGAVVGIFDTPSLHPNLTVRQSLEHAAILCKSPVRTCDEVESLLGITQYRKFKIRHLSLGNKRRASIAHALIGNPQLIILDEPFNGLDAEGVEDVLKLIKNLNSEAGTAFLLSSHQLPYLEQICSHLAILHNGSIVVSDAIDSLFHRHKTSLLVSCDAPEKARSIVEQSGLARFQTIDGAQLQFELDSGTAIEINRLLVNAGIGVSELSLKQESLGSLFHEITNSDDAEE